MNTRKICTKCLKRKPSDQFSGSTQCRTCRVEYFKTYNAKRYSTPQAQAAERERGKHKYHSVVRVRRIGRKKQLIALLGGACQLCGYHKSAAALDFHHVGEAAHRGKPNAEKLRTLSHLLAIEQPWAWTAALAEALKCRLLCSNCHREVTFPGHEL